MCPVGQFNIVKQSTNAKQHAITVYYTGIQWLSKL